MGNIIFQSNTKLSNYKESVCMCMYCTSGQPFKSTTNMELAINSSLSHNELTIAYRVHKLLYIPLQALLYTNIGLRHVVTLQ